MGKPFHAHHIVAKHRLAKDGHVEKLYDTRNALRLCEGLDTDRCHMEHEQGKVEVKTERLPDEAICFIWETLGVAGQNHLEREYTGIDRRYSLHVEGKCPTCQ